MAKAIDPLVVERMTVERQTDNYVRFLRPANSALVPIYVRTEKFGGRKPKLIEVSVTVLEWEA